jgi:hypothetical protein
MFGSAGCSLLGSEGLSYGLKALPRGTILHVLNGTVPATVYRIRYGKVIPAENVLCQAVEVL